MRCLATSNCHRAEKLRASSIDQSARNDTAFTPLDWALFAVASLGWGASFLFIEIGLDHLSPGAIAFLRVLFGAATLALFPAARASIGRVDLPLVALVGLVWMVVPFLLFPIAQRSIDSSLAGMINASAPLFVAAIAAVAVRSLPTRLQGIGLIIGLLGVVAISVPSIEGASSAGGVLLATFATLLYGVAINLTSPLQRRNGALPVIWRAQLVALVLLTPAGALGIADSEFAWSSLWAMVALGSIGTGAAFVCFTTLAGRVGPTRGSVVAYFLPVVAVLLGAILLDESVHPEALFGTALVLIGAYLASRAAKEDQRPIEEPVSVSGAFATEGGESQ